MIKLTKILLLALVPSCLTSDTPESVERIEAVGRWMEVNGEANYAPIGCQVVFASRWSRIS